MGIARRLALPGTLPGSKFAQGLGDGQAGTADGGQETAD